MMDELEKKSMDLMIGHENAEVLDRVACLEKKVAQQEDEIVCLKSALSDALRRIIAVEGDRGAGMNLLPNKPHVKTSRRMHVPPRPEPSTRKSVPDFSSQVRRGTSPSRGRPQSPSMKKWPSSSPDVSKDQTSGLKEATFNADETTLKMYLRGRPIHLIAPSDYAVDYDVNKRDEAPTEKLKLEWVYGYRGRDCRHNLYYLPTGEMLYFMASVVILYNVEEQTQRHYTGHTDDVKCLALHPDKITVASGQVAGHEKKAGKPHIRVWDSVSLTTLHVIGVGDFERAVCCIAFSKLDGGQFLCAVDEANEHNLSLWEFGKGDRCVKITETKSSTEPVLAAEFHPLERNLIVTCGKNQLTFWTIESGTLSKKLGLFERHDKPKYVLCLTFTDDGEILTGDSNGNIFVWGKEGNRITQAITGAHEGGIFSLCVMKDGTILSGGGKDRKIVQWDNSLKPTGLEAELPELYGPIRTLGQGKGNMILVGTTRNCILVGTLDFKFSAIVQGHLDELWGLAVHPNQMQFVTCAYDKQIYLWDTLTHSTIWQKEINEGAHCASYHPDGNTIVVGTQTGKWLAINSTTRDTLSCHTDGDEQLECIAFSPDGEHLAIGSRDNNVYIYLASEEGRKYSKVGKCSGHSSFITHLDWSVDGQYVRTNSGDYELLYWSANTCRQVSQSSTLKDISWASQNCTLDFNVAGIWPEGADGTDVNSCCRSNKANLLASGDDRGKVNLFTYPSSHLKASCRSFGGHSSHVTSVQFLYDDSRLLSVGGKDMAVLQWQIV